MSEPFIHQISLYSQEGGSNKEYHVQVIQDAQGYRVDFQYGRVGQTLKAGTKTAKPVSIDAAKKVFDKLVAEKVGKGYTPRGGVSNSPAAFQSATRAARDAGVRPQLLNSIEEEDLPALLRDPCWGLQEKMDGERRLVRKSGPDIDGITGITGINRKGLIVPLPIALVDEISKLPGDLLLDGEQIGDALYLFDLLEQGGKDLRGLGYYDRFVRLAAVIRPQVADCLRLVELHTTLEGKAQRLVLARKQNSEGIVLKRLDAPYLEGRPNSGGAQFKLKFYETASAIVSPAQPRDAKRSVAIESACGTPLGNVTIPPNQDIPDPGQVIEVRYLYAYRGGSLYQPTYLGPRTDIEPDECTLSQLKYKAEPGLNGVMAPAP